MTKLYFILLSKKQTILLVVSREIFLTEYKIDIIDNTCGYIGVKLFPPCLVSQYLSIHLDLIKETYL